MSEDLKMPNVRIKPDLLTRQIGSVLHKNALIEATYRTHAQLIALNNANDAI